MTDQEYRKMLRELDHSQRSNFIGRLRLLLEFVKPDGIKSVRIDEKDDSNNEHGICRMVIEHYDTTTSMINIEMNSVESIFNEFCRFVAGGRKCYGLYLDHNERVVK